MRTRSQSVGLRGPLMGAAISLGIICLAVPARAQALPHYDVKTSCEHIAGFGGNFSHQMFDSCLDEEQRVYDGLKAKWDKISPEIKKQCMEVAGFGGDPTYQMLSSCVDQENQAKQKSQGREFKY